MMQNRSGGDSVTPSMMQNRSGGDNVTHYHDAELFW